MKKWMAMLLGCVLALNLAACGAGTDGEMEDNAPLQDSTLHFEVTKTVYENEYKADDGTVLFSERYELPQLELRDENGERYTQTEKAAANSGTKDTALLGVQEAFNAEMESVLTSLRSEAEEMAESAKELYMTNSSNAVMLGSWMKELTVEEVYMTEGKLLSVMAEGYANYGGAHPFTGTHTWNFDLTTGEFLTFDALASEQGDVAGVSLQMRIYRNILGQIDAQGLSEWYFDDYDSYLSDFPSFAMIYFTAGGMKVVFDTYIIAPYAAGPQVFEVPYDAFYSALSEHAKEILDVPQEQLVLSDLDTAATLWSWLFMTTPPTGDTPDKAEINGYTYYSADIPGVSTLEDMQELMYRYFDRALADEWLEESERYAEVDGRLYVLDADRGSNDSIIDDVRSVTLDGEGGIVTQTVTYGEWNEASQSQVPNGEETFEYPFILIDGHAVFSAFPYPY